MALTLANCFLSWIEAVVRDMGMQDCPETLNRVQVWAICGQLDQVDAAFRT